jgi:hypothetical protein
MVGIKREEARVAGAPGHDRQYGHVSASMVVMAASTAGLTNTYFWEGRILTASLWRGGGKTPDFRGAMCRRRDKRKG